MTADENDTGEVASPTHRAGPGAIVGSGTGSGAVPTVASREGNLCRPNRGDQP